MSEGKGLTQKLKDVSLSFWVFLLGFLYKTPKNVNAIDLSIKTAVSSEQAILVANAIYSGTCFGGNKPRPLVNISVSDQKLAFKASRANRSLIARTRKIRFVPRSSRHAWKARCYLSFLNKRVQKEKRTRNRVIRNERHWDKYLSKKAASIEKKKKKKTPVSPCFFFFFFLNEDFFGFVGLKKFFFLGF